MRARLSGSPELGRWWLSAPLLLAFAATGGAADGDKAPAPAKPADTKSGDAKQADSKPASGKSANDAKDAKDKKAAAPAANPLALLRPAPRDLDEALRRLGTMRVSVAFKDMPFTEAVDYIRRVAGFNVIVAPALQMKGLDGIQPITLTLSEVTLRQVADLVAQFTSTKFKFDDGLLQFTTPDDARGKPVLRIYGIGDLTFRLRNFPGPDLNLRSSKAEFEPEPETEVDNAWSDPQKVVEMIQKMCAEETWADKDVSISADENKLIVKQYPEVQRQIARLIAMLRSAR